MKKFFCKKKLNKNKKTGGDSRLIFLLIIVFLFGGFIIFRLFSLQVINHNFYSALAAGQHEIYQSLFPERGKIWMQEVVDSAGSDEKILYPLATNQSLYLVYAEPNKIENPEEVAEKLVDILGIEEEIDNEDDEIIKRKMEKLKRPKRKK